MSTTFSKVLLKDGSIKSVKDTTARNSISDIQSDLVNIQSDINNLGTAANKNSTNAVTQSSTDLIESGAVYIELSNKVDKIVGKGLSENDFTNTLKTKLDNIAAGAEANVQSDWNQINNEADDYIKNKPNIPTVDAALDATSENTIQNKVVKEALDNKVDVVEGKGLSTEDYTTVEKTKLAGIEAGANNYILPPATSSTLGGVKPGTNMSIDANGVLSMASTDIVSATETWLGDHIDPTTGYVVDDTLSIIGAAADAKKTGDMIIDLKDASANVQNSLGVDFEVISNTYISDVGIVSYTNNYDVYAIKINPDDYIIDKIAVSPETERLAFAFYQSKPALGDTSYNNSRTLTNISVVEVENVIIPNNCTWLAIRVLKNKTPCVLPYTTYMATAKQINAISNKIDGILDSLPTKNLFNPETVSNNTYISNEGNVITDIDSDNALNYITSDYIQTNGAITITANGIDYEGTKFLIARYNIQKEFIERITPSTYTYTFGNADGYIRVSFIKTLGTNLNLVQIENGIASTYFVPHKMAYDYHAREILNNFSGAYESGMTNLVDDDNLIEGILINENGSQEENQKYNSTNYINVSMGFYIIRSFDYSETPMYRICLYDKNKTKIRRLTPSQSLYPNGYVFEVNANEKYVRVSFQSEANENGYQHKNVLCKSVVLNDFIPYHSTIDSAARLRLMQTEENLFPNIRNVGPMFSICDDDTTSDELVEIFHNVCTDENILGCYAVITFRLNNDSNLADRLKSYEAAGFGMYYHCQQQIAEYDPNAYDESVVQPNFVQGLKEFKNYDFLNPDVWIVPFGGALPAEIDMARRAGIHYVIEAERNVAEYERYVTTENYNVPSKYLNRYCVLRRSLGFGAGTPTINQIKASIDECVEKGGWIIFMTHANTWYEKDAHNNYIYDEHGNLVPILIDGITGVEKTKEILQYCKTKQMKNVTIKEGLRLYEASYTYYETVNQ